MCKALDDIYEAGREEERKRAEEEKKRAEEERREKEEALKRVRELEAILEDIRKEKNR